MTGRTRTFRASVMLQSAFGWYEWPRGFLSGRAQDNSPAKAFFASEDAIFQSPEFGARWRNDERQAATIRYFIRLFRRLRCAQFDVRYRHWGYRLSCIEAIPPNHSDLDGRRQTSQDKKACKIPILKGFFYEPIPS